MRDTDSMDCHTEHVDNTDGVKENHLVVRYLMKHEVVLLYMSLIVCHKLCHSDTLSMCVWCSVLDCRHPGNIPNGTVHVFGYTLGKRISYSCDVGYTLNGSSWRRCQSNGTWSGLKPTCECEYLYKRNQNC